MQWCDFKLNSNQRVRPQIDTSPIRSIPKPVHSQGVSAGANLYESELAIGIRECPSDAEEFHADAAQPRLRDPVQHSALESLRVCRAGAHCCGKDEGDQAANMTTLDGACEEPSTRYRSSTNGPLEFGAGLVPFAAKVTALG